MVRELIRVVAWFEVSQSLCWNLERMILSLLFVFGYEGDVGEEEEEEKSEKSEGVLWCEGMRERDREIMFVCLDFGEW